MSNSVLNIENLVAGYGHFTALHGISLQVNSGEMVALIGANGAGKSTTLRAISGMIKATGTVEIDGRSIVGKSPEQVVRAGIAHSPEGRGTFNRLSVRDNLRVGAATRRDRDIDHDIDEWFEFFPRLGERRNQQAGSMSGGEQQMLALARAMMARPSLLLLDEPSLGLAPNLTELMFERLVEINSTRGTAMLVVEQNANLALKSTHRAYVLETGEISTSGLSHELQNDESIRRAYLHV